MSITDKLRELVSLDTPKYEAGTKKAKLIAVCSQKGGVGKTTTAVNLGTSFASFHNKKVLVVDLDPQGHVEKSLSALVQNGLAYNPLSKVLMEKHGDLLDAAIKTELENFHLTAGDKELVGTESAIGTRIGREFILRESLATARTHYDFIFFDCPPSLGNLTMNALVAADYAILPCEMSVLAFEGVSDVLETFREINVRLNEKLKLLGVLFTRVDGRNTTMNDLIIENMKKFVAEKLFRTQIAVNTAINKSQLEGRPIFHFAPASTGSENYRALAAEVLQRIKSEATPVRVKDRQLARSA